MNSFANQQQSDEHRILFFRNLKKKLNGTPTRKIISIVRIVLSKLKSSFSSQQLNETLTYAPAFVQLLVGHDQHNREIQINHLDELVDLLIAEDKRLGTRLFKSEIETLNVVILILKQIQISFEKMGINILPHTLERELQGAMID
jgi:hypothetical protein